MDFILRYDTFLFGIRNDQPELWQRWIILHNHPVVKILRPIQNGHNFADGPHVGPMNLAIGIYSTVITFLPGKVLNKTVLLCIEFQALCTKQSAYSTSFSSLMDQLLHPKARPWNAISIYSTVSLKRDQYCPKQPQLTFQNLSFHDDVIKRKHLPRYWLFVMWFDMPSCPLWRHCNVRVRFLVQILIWILRRCVQYIDMTHTTHHTTHAHTHTHTHTP